MDDAETTALRDRLKRALDCLREWRDKRGGTEFHRVGASVHQTDLLRETIRILENR